MRRIEITYPGDPFTTTSFPLDDIQLSKVISNSVFKAAREGVESALLKHWPHVKLAHSFHPYTLTAVRRLP